MEGTATVQLGGLKSGDLFQFAPSKRRELQTGERLPVWKVDSIGDPLCSVTLESMADSGARQAFSVPPILLSAGTPVVPLSAEAVDD